MKSLRAFKYLAAAVFILVYHNYSSAYAQIIPPVDRQHGMPGMPPPSFNETSTVGLTNPNFSGSYRIETSLRFLAPPHVTDIPHPYPNPEPDFQHHHAFAPAPFSFIERFHVPQTGGVGSEAAILAGSPNVVNPGDPYSNIYSLVFTKDGNAKFDNITAWTGTIQIVTGSTINNFGFGLDILGGGGSVNFGLTAPTQFVLSFTGDIDTPTFSFDYVDGFSMDNATLTINGFASTLNPTSAEFGRIRTNGAASIIEDVSVLADLEFIGSLHAPVYDVVHGVPTVPDDSNTLALFAASVIAMYIALLDRKRRASL